MRRGQAARPRLQPHSPWARLQALELDLLQISLALKCSPHTLELMPLGRLKAMARELGKISDRMSKGASRA